jgi:cytoskeletal protein CcmA (bactofilin family)
MVLCYTQPGKSLEVAYRVSSVLSDFSLINFTIDRYEYDSVLSNNYIKTDINGTGTITANTASNTVVGSSTAFTYELYPGKIIYVDNVVLGTVSNVVSSTNVTLTANANSNVSSNSFTYSGNVFTVNNFVTASGNINANTSSKYIEGIVTNIAGTGLISATTSSTTVTGIGTAFNTELQVGKTLYYSGNSIGRITSISSNAILTIETPVSSSLSNVAFTASGTTTLFATELHIGDTIVVNSNVRLGTVANIHSNTNVELYSNSLSTVSNVSYHHTARDSYTTQGQGDKYLKFPQIGVLS